MLSTPVRRIASAAVIFIVMLLLQPAAASANGGPLYYPADASGLLQFDTDTNISLIREKVAFTIEGNDEWYRNNADVAVHYELRSNAAERKEIKVLFLTPYSGHLVVSEKLDGSDRIIPITAATPEKPDNWNPKLIKNVYDPVSGKPLGLSSRGTASINKAEGSAFRLLFEPYETKQITIRYSEESGMYDKGVIHTVFSHLYYLTPASFWEGEPVVELEVTLKEEGGVLHSNLPLTNTGPTVYSAVLDGLPQEEWYFSYAYPSRLLFPTNLEGEHNLLVLGTALLMTAAAAGLALLLRNVFVMTGASAGIMAFTVYYITKMGGYPFNPIFVGMTNLALLVLLLFINYRVGKRIRRWKGTGNDKAS